MAKTMRARPAAQWALRAPETVWGLEAVQTRRSPSPSWGESLFQSAAASLQSASSPTAKVRKQVTRQVTRQVGRQVKTASIRARPLPAQQTLQSLWEPQHARSPPLRWACRTRCRTSRPASIPHHNARTSRQPERQLVPQSRRAARRTSHRTSLPAERSLRTPDKRPQASRHQAVHPRLFRTAGKTFPILPPCIWDTAYSPPSRRTSPQEPSPVVSRRPNRRATAFDDRGPTTGD